MNYSSLLIRAFNKLSKKLSDRSKQLSYLAAIQHFEERWIQVEYSICLQELMFKSHSVWMEGGKEKIDASIYSKTNDLVCVVEIKTVKNYEVSYWLDKFENDIKKLVEIKRDKLKDRYFLVFYLYAAPQGWWQWERKDKTKQYREEKECGSLIEKKLDELKLTYKTKDYIKIKNKLSFLKDEYSNELSLTGYLIKI
ncbi:MAG: hypothetical protein LHV68_04265 [Elusimicrobia bacterium]|nr:hypothetical protein [Candidatus Liberimonas magnetica]